MKKTTQKQLREFKKSFLHTAERLGLSDYKVYFDFVASDEHYAEIQVNQKGKVATAFLCSRYDSILDPSECGKHEAIHLLLARLRFEAHTRYTNEFDIDQSEEEIVRRLEKVL